MVPAEVTLKVAKDDQGTDEKMNVSKRNAFIESRNVTKIYRTSAGKPIHAVDNVSFKVSRGDIFTIVGPSGCGKTTLLKMIAGLLPPTDGENLIDGRPVLKPIGNVGMVFQRPVLFKWLKVLGNVLAPIDLTGLKKAAYKERAYELLKLVKLDGFEDKYPKELSGGMQQRVSIARSLILDPEVLLMDEPFGALDALTRDEMNLELLRIWREKKKTILFVTHNIQEAVFLGDKVVVLSERPARVKEIVQVDLPRPRRIEIRSDKAFGEYALDIYSLITGYERSVLLV